MIRDEDNPMLTDAARERARAKRLAEEERRRGEAAAEGLVTDAEEKMREKHKHFTWMPTAWLDTMFERTKRADKVLFVGVKGEF